MAFDGPAEDVEGVEDPDAAVCPIRSKSDLGLGLLALGSVGGWISGRKKSSRSITSSSFNMRSARIVNSYQKKTGP